MGKSTGKTLFSIAGALIGGYTKIFGTGLSWLQGAVYGASLFGTVWTATHRPGTPAATFNTAKNEIGMDRMIPIVYGTRKWTGGLETWQSTNSSTTKMTKDIILSEGEITEAIGVCANMRPIGKQVIFAIKNMAYSDATVRIQNSYLYLYCNGTTTSIHLQSTTSVDSNLDNEINCSTLKLAQYIEKLGNGWKIDFNCGADLSPSDFYAMSTTNCYKADVRLYISAETGSSYTIYTGSASQSPPSNYSTTGSYKNTAWIRASLVATSTLSFANPNITCVIRGKKIYDTRTGTTIYSENPSMCLRDYMLNKRFGMGRWITSSMLDEDSFKEAADYCDENITYTDAYGINITEPRYTLNLILAESRKHIDNVQDFLAVFGGFLVFTGDKIAVKLEKQDTISATFDESNIKKDSVKFTYTNLTDCPNRYDISYYESAQDWAGIKVQVNDTADQYKRGNIVTKDVTLQGCTSQGQALRLGKMYKAINRLNGAGLTFSTGTTAMHLQPGDIIKFNYRVVTDASFRITSISEQKGEYQLQCQQYNSTIYDDALGSEISIPNIVTSSNPFVSEVPNISNIGTTQTYYTQKDGVIVSTINITWNNPTYTYYYKTYVYYSVDGGNSYLLLNSTNTEVIQLDNALVGSTYIFKLIVENTAQRFSTGITSDSIVCTGKDSPPSNVTGITGIIDIDKTTMIISWIAVSDIDLRGYQISVNGSIVTGNPISTNKYTYIAPSSGTYLFSVVGVDNSGNISTTPATITLSTTLEPNAPSNFIAVQSSADRSILQLSWDAVTNIPISGYEIRYGDNWNSGTTILSQLKATTVSIKAPGSGYFKFFLRALSTQGYYSLTDATFNIQIILAPDAVTNLKVVQLIGDRSKALISFTGSQGNDISGYEIRYGDSWNSGTTVIITKESQYTWAPPQSGTYNVMVRAETTYGYYSAITNKSITISIEAYDVEGFTSTQSSINKSTINLTWNAPLDSDISYYVIKQGLTWDSGIIIGARVTGTSYSVTINEEDDFIWWIKAVNYGGNLSQFPAETQGIFNLNPTPVTSIQIFQSSTNRETLNIQWNQVVDGDLSGYQVKIGQIWESAEALPLTKELYTTYTIQSSGNVKVMIKTVNTAGYYSDEYSTYLYCAIEPTNCTNFMSYQNGGTVELYWKKSIDDDVTAYEIREGANFNQGALIATGITQTKYVVNVDTERDYKYFIKAINLGGNYSLSALNTAISVANLPIKNVIETFDEITLNSGTHTNTEFGESLINFSNLGGRFSDYPTTKFSDVGGKTVLKLKKHNLYLQSNLSTLYSSNSTTVFAATKQSDGYWRAALTGFSECTCNSYIPILPNTEYTESFYFKSDGNIAGLQISFFTNNGHHYIQANITSVGNGIFRASASYMSSSSDTSLRVIDFAAVVGTATYIDIANAQLEVGDLTGYESYFDNGVYTAEIIDIGSSITANITANFISTVILKGTGSAVLQIRTSQDGSSWVEWTEFKPVQYTFRYAQFKVLLGTTDTTKTPEVNQFSISIDVPDTDIALSTSIQIGGTTVNYGHTYYTIPVVTPTAVGDNLHAVLISKGLSSCIIKVKNEQNVETLGTIDLRVKGY